MALALPPVVGGRVREHGGGRGRTRCFAKTTGVVSKRRAVRRFQAVRHYLEVCPELVSRMPSGAWSGGTSSADSTSWILPSGDTSERSEEQIAVNLEEWRPEAQLVGNLFHPGVKGGSAA